MRAELDKARAEDVSSLELQCENFSAGPGAAVWG